MSRVLKTSLVIEEPEPDHRREPGVQRARSMKDVIPKDTWTVFKIMGEFVEGFETLRVVEPAVSIFGGSRVRKGSAHYRKAVQVAQALARDGFSIITGGGPGVMEAANLGARRGGGRSVGLNIRLPFEHQPNRHNQEYMRAKRDRMGHLLHHQGLALDEQMIHDEQVQDRKRG